jgi:hypothetical protein
MDPLLVALLSHSGYQLPLGSDEELWSALCRAFSRIPYENITKILRVQGELNQPHKESPEELIGSFISHGTGGTCFPLTATLTRLVRSLGFEAHPILADRRYGTDTHCALILRKGSAAWQLLDPGYLIFTPCTIPSSGTLRYDLPLTPIELVASPIPERVELYTVTASPKGELIRKLRLTYKVRPVDELEFTIAWDRSFGWEMMQYPIISSLVGDTHVYFQKSALLLRSPSQSTREILTQERMLDEITQRLGISRDIVKRALSCL